MNDATLLEQLAATDAYAPDTAMPAAAWTKAATLAEIERLIEEPAGEPAATSPARRTVQPGRRRGLLVATVAFVVVLVIGIGLLALVDPPPEPATTTTPPTTTTIAPTTTTEASPTTTTEPTPSTTLPPVDVAAMAFFDAMAGEFNAGDAEAAANRVLSAEEFDAPFFTDDDNDMRPILASMVRLWGELESTLTFDECRTSSFGITTCVLFRDSPHNPSFPIPEESVWQIRVDGETLLFMQWRPDFTAPYRPIEVEFETWLETNYPDLALQYASAQTFVIDTAEAADVVRRAVALWRSETGR